MGIQDTYNLLALYHGQPLADRITDRVVGVVIRQDLGPCLEKVNNQAGERYR